MLFEPTPTSYQEVPYPNDPYRSSHPDQLATVAILAGLTPPAVSRCRVLELGCARGGNLIPMAVEMPEAAFVGFDSSGHQVLEACELIERVGLGNIRVEARDILDLDAAIGTFDFIICHGTYSWVEPEVQEKILELSARCLAPDGLIYVSYNTFPGWHFRGLARELMCYHARRFEKPEVRAREARGVLQFVTTSAQGIEPVYSNLLRQELDYITARDDAYLLHDHLESVNLPIYFHEFVERAGRHGLQFGTEVQNTLIPSESLPAGIADGLRQLAATKSSTSSSWTSSSTGGSVRAFFATAGLNGSAVCGAANCTAFTSRRTAQGSRIRPRRRMSRLSKRRLTSFRSSGRSRSRLNRCCNEWRPRWTDPPAFRLRRAEAVRERSRRDLFGALGRNALSLGPCRRRSWSRSARGQLPAPWPACRRSLATRSRICGTRLAN